MVKPAAVRPSATSVVVPRLKEIDLVSLHHVHEAMLFGHAAGPCPCQNVLQWLGLADATEGIVYSRFNEVQHAAGDGAVGLNPVTQVLTKLQMEDSERLRTSGGALTSWTAKGSGSTARMSPVLLGEVTESTGCGARVVERPKDPPRLHRRLRCLDVPPQLLQKLVPVLQDLRPQHHVSMLGADLKEGASFKPRASRIGFGMLTW